MTTAVTELYDALRKAGVDEESAMKAARAVSSSDLSHLATKADLKAGLAELETVIIKWNTGTVIAATGIFAAIVKLF